MATIARASQPKRAKNIIWCVSDGMSAGVPSMLHHFLQITEGRNSPWSEMCKLPGAVHGFMDTRSLDSMMTDSAAAATSWGSGTHVLNGAINTLPGGLELTPLYDLLGAQGMKRGLVTTATITHATPSGFAVCSAKRSAEPEIARQYRTRGVEVLMGGGNQFFAADKRADKVDVYGEYSADGYAVCRSRDELMAAAGKSKILGIFAEGQIPFTVDRDHNPEIAAVVPTLAEMARVAIDALKGTGDGFVLQIEGARVDHAAHPNDLAGLIYDQLAYEEALQVALDFALADGETLVVSTSDHGNANPGISNGPSYYGEANGLAKLKGMTSSYERMATDLTAAETVGSLQALIEAKLGIQLTDEQASGVLTAPLAGFGNYGFATAALSMALGSHTGVGWSSGNHTSDWTKLTAIGPGAELFAGLVENVECFGKLLALREIAFENPKMSLEEAKRIAEAEKASALVEPHWV